MNNTFYPTIIIGAGQAGLAIAHYLHKDNRDFIILEKDQVASGWINRYDCLKLITPNPFNYMPGAAIETAEKFPAKEDVVKFLQNYASAFMDRIFEGTKVNTVSKPEKHFIIETNKGNFECRNLIVSSGYYATPFIPPLAYGLSRDVVQMHSLHYRNLGSFPDRKLNIAVIGSANSGISIAKELSTKHNVSLFEGNLKRFPRKLLGIDIFWWFKLIGIFKIGRHSRLGKKMSNKLMFVGDATYGLYPKALSKKHGFDLFARLTKCEGNLLTDSEGRKVNVDGIVWATGFRTNYHKFIQLDIFGDKNSVIHDRGVTSIENLYFMGLKWQYNINSFLLFGVGRDAEYIYNYMVQKNTFDTPKKQNEILIS